MEDEMEMSLRKITALLIARCCSSCVSFDFDREFLFNTFSRFKPIFAIAIQPYSSD